jgi:hypothetical protein
MPIKLKRLNVVAFVAASLIAFSGCAKIPDESAFTDSVVPLPMEIDEIDSSKLIPTEERRNCLKTPSLDTAAKHRENPLVGGGVYGTYDWAAGKTNGGQLWKTRLSYSKSSLAQVRIVPTFAQIGNVSTQKKLAARINASAYVNGDFYNLRGTNLLFSAMIQGEELVYSPGEPTPIVGVVENPANEHTGVQGKSHIVANGKKIFTQGLNLQYLAANSIGAYNNIKNTFGLPKVSYVVLASNGVVTSSKPATDFKPPSKPGDYVFVAEGLGADLLSTLEVGDSVDYVKPVKAKTTKFLRTEISPAGSVTLPDGESLPIRAVNHRGVNIKVGVVLFTSKLYPTTSRLAATVVTDLDGVVTKIYKDGQSVNVGAKQLVLQVGPRSAELVRNLKIGAKLKINNSYEIKKDLPLYSAFGNRENLMINSVITAYCTPSHEDIRPRNAMGWNENGDVWFANTTMGVRNSADVFNRFRLGGSTVHQLAKWLKEMGATQAIMLDGGGSTTMLVQTPDSDYKRVDLPPSEWVRAVPQGITMVTR